jgi:hypothetical protein
MPIGRTADILRWIAVLPAAIGAWIGIQLLLILMSFMFTPYRYADWVLQITTTAFSSYVFVTLGAYTAPRFQYQTGIVLAIFLGIITVMVATARWFIPSTDVPAWWITIVSLIGLVSTVVAVIHLGQKRDFLR